MMTTNNEQRKTEEKLNWIFRKRHVGGLGSFYSCSQVYSWLLFLFFTLTAFLALFLLLQLLLWSTEWLSLVLDWIILIPACQQKKKSVTICVVVVLWTLKMDTKELKKHKTCCWEICWFTGFKLNCLKNIFYLHHSLLLWLRFEFQFFSAPPLPPPPPLHNISVPTGEETYKMLYHMLM